MSVGREVRIFARTTISEYLPYTDELGSPKRRTLGSYVEEFGGDFEGEIRDPFGLKHTISLAAFRDLSLETPIRIAFEMSGNGKRLGPADADSGVVVLKEYQAPEDVDIPQSVRKFLKD